MRRALLVWATIAAIFAPCAVAFAQNLTQSSAGALTNVHVSNITSTSARVTWTTNVPADSRVYFGPTSGASNNYSINRCDNTGFVIDHCVNLGPLTPSMTFYFTPESRDQLNNVFRAPEGSFMTLAYQSTETSQTTNTTTTTSGSTATTTSSGTGSAGTSDLSGSTTSTSTTTGTSNTTTQTASTTTTTSTSNTDTTPPKISYFSYTNGGGLIKAGVLFTEQIDPQSVQPGSVFVLKTSTSEKVFGSVNVSASSIAFTSATALQYSTEYQLVVLHGIRDLAGNMMATDYYSPKFGFASSTTNVLPQPLATTTVTTTTTATTTSSLITAVDETVKMLTGIVRFGNGTPVANARVDAYSSALGKFVTATSNGNGQYSLQLAAGQWEVRANTTDGTASSGATAQVVFAASFAAETRNLDMTLPLVLASTLTVKATDDTGAPLSNIYVTVDTSSMFTTGSVHNSQSLTTDAGGSASFKLPAGTFFVRTQVPTERNLINPDEQSVSLGQETKSVSLVFKRLATVTERAAEIHTSLDSGAGVSAYVYAWSERGESRHANTDVGGALSLPITAGTRWHFGAGTQIDGFPYRSSEVVVEDGDAAPNVSLSLSKTSTIELRPSAIVRPSTENITLQDTSGAQMVMPQNAANVSGSVEVKISPTVEVPSQAAARVIGSAYDITVKDAAGNSIKKFGKNIEISLPFDPTALAKQGIKDTSLSPTYFDESLGVWKSIRAFVVDRVHSKVIASVDHLTRFALVSAADVVAPAAPLLLGARYAANGAVLLSWKNPASDFDHSKVYRSQVAKVLGSVLGPEVIAESFIDATAKAGVLYYYAVRAVDTAGNESNNANQVSISGRSLIGGAAATAITHSLSLGSRGAEVTLLQKFLIERNYLSATATGYFGPKTKAAVIAFQNEHKDEILTPSGLSIGSGLVGKMTRALINKMIASGAR